MEAFHNHAFNSIAWVLKGTLTENMLDGKVNTHKSSIFPFYVSREDFHKVDSDGTTWVLNIRGPWLNKWKEYLPTESRFRTLTNGRIEVAT